MPHTGHRASAAPEGVTACALPSGALLAAYQAQGAYTDCFCVAIGRSVGLPEFVSAFYTTWLFRLERVILKWLLKRPSSDEDVRRLVDEESQEFAAWSVEGRAPNQLLMCDMHERTRSWFMAVADDNHPQRTMLYFGSAVVPLATAEDGKPRMGVGFGLLKSFHVGYSRALLALARSRIAKQSP